MLSSVYYILDCPQGNYKAGSKQFS